MLDFLKKYWWVVLVALLILIYVVSQVKKAKAAQAATDNLKATQIERVTTSTGGVVISSPTKSPGQTPSAPAQPYLLSRQQCKATCKGQCGSRPVVAVGKYAKAKKKCWDACKNNVCGMGSNVNLG
jgi:hypothetical protein